MSERQSKPGSLRPPVTTFFMGSRTRPDSPGLDDDAEVLSLTSATTVRRWSIVTTLFPKHP